MSARASADARVAAASVRELRTVASSALRAVRAAASARAFAAVVAGDMSLAGVTDKLSTSDLTFNDTGNTKLLGKAK